MLGLTVWYWVALVEASDVYSLTLRSSTHRTEFTSVMRNVEVDLDEDLLSGFNRLLSRIDSSHFVRIRPERSYWMSADE